MVGGCRAGLVLARVGTWVVGGEGGFWARSAWFLFCDNPHGGAVCPAAERIAPQRLHLIPFDSIWLHQGFVWVPFGMPFRAFVAVMSNLLVTLWLHFVTHWLHFGYILVTVS